MADRVYAHSDIMEGFTGDLDALVIYDRGTKFIDCYPLRSKSSDDAYTAFQDFRGTKYLDLVYVDNSLELKKAVEDLGFPRRTSQPGVPQSNGVVENKVKLCVAGAKTLMECAGLPACFWPYAVRAWTFGRNTDIVEGDSPWNRRHGQGNFKGPRIPFGAQVIFRQSPTVKERKHKFEPDGKPGVFLGYVVQPGGLWKGEFYVAPLQQFVGVSLHRRAPGKDTCVQVQRVREALFDKNDLVSR